MNKTFKKILPVLLLIWPYLCVIPFGIGSANEDFYGPVMGIYMVLTVAVYLLNIICVCMDEDEAAHRRLAFWDMVMKVAHIPFYLVVDHSSAGNGVCDTVHGRNSYSGRFDADGYHIALWSECTAKRLPFRPII